MKYMYLTLICAIVLVWTVYFTRDRHSRKVSDESSRTEIEVNNKIFNNGISLYKYPVTGKYEISNTGDQPLIINDVKTDCNCTVPDWEHTPILPHHKTVIKLVYNGTSLGFFQKKAIVYNNSQENPLLLVIRGEIVNK